ncbi:MAG: AraC family transcriptional regulator [Spirochaetaceae bacterium]
MIEQYDFSEISYEFIGHESSMPFKSFFISVGYRGGHWHREFELILVLDGELIITRGIDTQKLIKGDIYLLNPYEMHGFVKGEKPNLLLVIQIDPIISSACPFNLHYYNFLLTPASNPTLIVKNRIINYMLSIIKNIENRKIGYEYMCMSELHSLIALLLQEVEYTQGTDTEINTKIESIERMSKLIEYINLHHEEDIALADLAELVNLSTFYVSHLIKENTGLSFRQNLSQIRTHHAISLMLNTNMKLVDIALESGFSDIKYFNRSFKKLYGETPSQLRKIENWKEVIQLEQNNNLRSLNELLPYITDLLVEK